MSLTRHGQEYRDQRELDTSRNRARKLGRVEFSNGKPRDDIYSKTDYYDKGRFDDVSTFPNTGSDIKQVKSPGVDHRPNNQRIRLKRNTSADSFADRRVKKQTNNPKTSESGRRRDTNSADSQAGSKGQRRVLPSTPASKISYYGRDDNSVSVSSSMPVKKPNVSQTPYSQNKHDNNDIGENKSNKGKLRVSKPREPKDQKQTVPKKVSRDEVIPLKEIRSYTPGDKASPRTLRHQGDARRRQDGTAVTVTFQMQDNVHSPKETGGKRGSCQMREQHAEQVHDKTNFKRDYPSHGSSSVPTVQKHYLSPDGHPSMVERSKTQNRLQNQSSTETSGLGETITSGFSSQESIASHYSGTRVGADTGPNSCYDQGIDLSEDTRSITEDRYSTFESKPIDSDKTSIPVYESYRSRAKSLSPTKVSSTGKGETKESARSSQDTRSKKRKSSDTTTSSKQMRDGFKRQEVFLGPTDQLNNNRSSKNPATSQTTSSKPPKTLDLGSYNAGPNFDELFMQSETLPVPQTTMGLQVDQINNEWNKHNRASSIKSRSSHGSFRSRSGSTRRSKRFLSETESRWMKWGRERRASFRRRLEKMEKAEPEVQPRPSTPVKKARQEGLMFIHPDLESKYISEEDINYIQRHRQERLKTYKVIEKAKKTPCQYENHEMNRLTVTELNILTRFWEHRVFVRSRYISILLSLGTILLYVISICSDQWISYPSLNGLSRKAHEGLWYKCRPVFQSNVHSESCDESAHREKKQDQDMWSSLWNYKCTQADNSTDTRCLDTFPHWQNAVIGLMLFSAAFGFVAAVLAICGVCTSPLPKKIYYFHSAGEIFFVCALSTTVALIIYPVAIAMDDSIQSHTYGSGYGLGWGGTAFFFAASLCMSLDELVRESSQNKCCRYLCWRSRTGNRGEHPV